MEQQDFSLNFNDKSPETDFDNIEDLYHSTYDLVIELTEFRYKEARLILISILDRFNYTIDDPTYMRTIYLAIQEHEKNAKRARSKMLDDARRKIEGITRFWSKKKITAVDDLHEHGTKVLQNLVKELHEANQLRDITGNIALKPRMTPQKTLDMSELLDKMKYIVEEVLVFPSDFTISSSLQNEISSIDADQLNFVKQLLVESIEKEQAMSSICKICGSRIANGEMALHRMQKHS